MSKQSIRNYPHQSVSSKAAGIEKLLDRNIQRLPTPSRQAGHAIDHLAEKYLAALTRALDAAEGSRARYVYLGMIEQALHPFSKKRLALVPAQTVAMALPQLVALEGYKSSTELQDLMCGLLRLTCTGHGLNSSQTASTTTQAAASLADSPSLVLGDVATEKNSICVTTNITKSTPPEATPLDDDAWADTQPNDPTQCDDKPVPMPRPPVNWGTNMPDRGMLWW